jgi:hypothetical protein
MFVRHVWDLASKTARWPVAGTAFHPNRVTMIKIW